MKLIFEASLGTDAWFLINPIKLVTFKRTKTNILDDIKNKLIENNPKFPELKDVYLEINGYDENEDKKVDHVNMIICLPNLEYEIDLSNFGNQITKRFVETINIRIEKHIVNKYKSLLETLDINDYEVWIDDWRLEL